MKLQRKFRIKFERTTYQSGSIDILASDTVDAEEKFWLMEEEGDLANHRDYHLETFALDEHEVDSIEQVETAQER